MLQIMDSDIDAAENMAHVATQQLGGEDRGPAFPVRGHQADANKAALQPEARNCRRWSSACLRFTRWNAEPAPCFFGTSLA